MKNYSGKNRQHSYLDNHRCFSCFIKRHNMDPRLADQFYEMFHIYGDSFRLIQHVLYEEISLVLWLFIDHADHVDRGYTTMRYTEEEYAQCVIINRFEFFAPVENCMCM